ncbi:hypothetical protein ACFYQA_39090 [Streptomyces sp. NPDC005774]
MVIVSSPDATDRDELVAAHVGSTIDPLTPAADFGGGEGRQRR